MKILNLFELYIEVAFLVALIQIYFFGRTGDRK